MDWQQCSFEEESPKRKQETLIMRENLQELRTKFIQLERAFEVNLKTQSRLEMKVDCLTRENQELQRCNEDALRRQTKAATRLMDAINERDHWKNGFLRQKELLERSQVVCKSTVDSVKRQCENVLEMTRETARSHCQEVVELYDNARKKIDHLEKQIQQVQQDCQKTHENRSFELAYLLETLGRFDLNVETVCHLAAEALKNLTEPGESFENSLKNLRKLFWATKKQNDRSELVFLRKQNFVLGEVVKDLKRKTSPSSQDTIPERKNGETKDQHGTQKETNAKNFNTSGPNKDTNYTLRERNSPYVLMQETSLNLATNARENGRDCEIRTNTSGIDNKENEKKYIMLESKKVLRIQSHCNGTVYEEYVIRISNDQEIKIKYPIKMNMDWVKMEFVDDETEYEKSILEKGMLIYLKNIRVSVKVKRSGVHCSTQTIKIKSSNQFTQTTLTGKNSFARLNSGLTILNSEKRAIERGLSKLERTVADLKFDTLGQARILIGKDS